MTRATESSSTEARHSSTCATCWIFLLQSLSVLLGARPACKDEADLVDQVGNVVDDVEGNLIGDTSQEAEEVAERVDGPAKADDHTHVAEGLLDSGGALAGLLGGWAHEDLVQDEEPAAQAEDESRPAEARGGLANVAEGKHEDGADEQAPEATGTRVVL